VQGPFATARFNAPTCLVPSTSKPGMAFLCDTGNNAVRVIFMETGACVWGAWGWVSGQFFAECKTIGALSPAPLVHFLRYDSVRLCCARLNPVVCLSPGNVSNAHMGSIMGPRAVLPAVVGGVRSLFVTGDSNLIHVVNLMTGVWRGVS
jgi:hypothetical protein